MIKDQLENDLIGSKVEEVAGAGESYYIGEYKSVILYKVMKIGNNEAQKICWMQSGIKPRSLDCGPVCYPLHSNDPQSKYECK